MEKLWSTWRSHYIDGFKHQTGDEECVFCAAVGQNETSDDSLVVYKGELAFLIMNLYPYNGGHVMIVPKRHISDIKELTSEEFSEIYEIIQKTVRALDNTMKPQGYNIGANIGKVSGAGIDQHIHFHIVPRWDGDTNFMTTIGEVKVISQDLLDIKKRIQKALSEQ